MVQAASKKSTPMANNVRTTHNAQLRDSDVAVEYLSEALEEGDAAVILMALRNIAEAQEDGITGLATELLMASKRVRRS